MELIKNNMKKEPSLKQILLDYLNKQENWVTKGELGIVAEKAGYLPESCGRHLRKMAEDKEILVSYYQGKRKQKLSRYARLDTPQPKLEIRKVEIIMVNGMPMAVLK